jgi:hypothetical protein
MNEMNKQPELKTILKPLAWVIVLTGWLFYAGVILMEFLHPATHDPIDTIRNFTQNLKRAAQDWGFSLFMLSFIVLYCVCWGYIKGDKK